MSNTGIVHPTFQFRNLHLRDDVQEKENVNNRADYVGLNLLKSQHLVSLIAFIKEIGMAKTHLTHSTKHRFTFLTESLYCFYQHKVFVRSQDPLSVSSLGFHTLKIRGLTHQP